MLKSPPQIKGFIDLPGYVTHAWHRLQREHIHKCMGETFHARLLGG